MRERGKLTAVVTGTVAILLGVLYLLITFILDNRGVLQPAPTIDVGWLLSRFVAW
ncbi:hypothetical protein [Gloeomargarita sp.]